jgi:hypothetical protein
MGHSNSVMFRMGLVLLTAGLGACVEVQANVPNVEITQHGVMFQGVPGAKQFGEVSVTHTFTLSGDQLSFTKDMNSQVYAMEVILRPTGSMQNLDFIRTARVLMSSPTKGGVQPATEIINYERANDQVSQPILSVKTLVPIDITELWAAEKTDITLTISGVLPEADWSVDVALRLGGKIEYKL